MIQIKKVSLSYVKGKKVIVSGAGNVAIYAAEKAIEITGSFLLRSYLDNNDTHARQKMHIASCLAGLAFNTASLGINHSMAHQLGATFHIPHGRANAMLLPTVMEFNAPVCLDKYVEIAKAMDAYREGMTKEEAADAACKAVRHLAIEVGILIACLLFMRRMSEVTNVSVETEEIDLSADSDLPDNVEHLAIPDRVEVYEINGPYFFGIANRFEEVMNDVGTIPSVRIIRMRKVPFIDSTGVHNLTNLCEKCLQKDIRIVLSGVNPKVLEVLTKAGFDQLIGKDNICSHITIALERARVLAEGLK